MSIVVLFCYFEREVMNDAKHWSKKMPASVLASN